MSGSCRRCVRRISSLRLEHFVTARWYGRGGGDSLNAYIREIAKFKPLSADDEKALGRRIQRGDQEALQRRLWREEMRTRVPTLDEALHHGGRVLDVGCGPGLMLLQLAADYPTAHFPHIRSKRAIRNRRHGSQYKGILLKFRNQIDHWIVVPRLTSRVTSPKSVL